MKKILYITLFFLILPISNIRAQQSANLTPYTGTWRYTNSATSEEFTIKLRETTYTYQNDPPKQCIIGVYIYKKSGQVIHDNSSEFMSSISATRMPIYVSMGGSKEANPSRLCLYVRDYGKMKDGRPKLSVGWLTLISSSNPNQLKWQPEEQEAIYMMGDAPIPGFSIPVDIILTKVE